MVKNQTEFENKHPKDTKEIKVKSKDFQGRLVIENYPNLEKLYLRDIESVDQIILRNLEQLQTCTIWNCGTSELIIENCYKVSNLNVQDNSLISLEFLRNLKELEKLELDDNTEVNSRLEYLPTSLKTFSYENTKLVEILKPYQGDWKTYRKDIQELIALSNQNPQELLKSIRDLKEEIKKLKDKQPVTTDNSVDFEKKYQKLKKTFNSLLKEEKTKTEEIEILEEETKEIILVEEEQNNIVTNDLIESLKEQKNDLSNLKKTNRELREKFAPFEKFYQKIEQKEKELTELKNNIISNNPETEDNLKELLEAQKENVPNWLENCKKRLTKQKMKAEEIDNLCQKQEQITQLRLGLQRKFNQQEKKLNQIFTNSTEELIKLLIKKELKEESIEKISFFSTWFNENCTLVISKEKKLIGSGDCRLWLAIYEPSFGESEPIIKLVKVAKKITEISEDWETTIDYFKDSLDSEYPAAKLYNNTYTLDLPPLSQDYKNVIKIFKKLSSSDHPDNFIRPYDIVKVDRRKVGIPYQHVVIYLGNGQVAHIPDDKNPVRIDSWENFLNSEKEVEIHHPFIPFKKPKLIQEHVDIAFKSEFGKGKYHFFKENCEHFATMCVYGLGFCRQRNINTINEITKNSDYLLQAIKASNEFFKSLQTQESQQEQVQTDWTAIHSDFTSNLIQSWQALNFTYSQVKEWLDIGLTVNDANFCAWLKDVQQLTPEQVLNQVQESELRVEYKFYLKNNSKGQSRKLKEDSSQLTIINKQIKEIEREINLLKDGDELAELVSKFVEANKKIIKEDKGSIKEVKKLHKTLEEKGFLKKDIEKIIRCCERLVDLEWQKEQEIPQKNIEIPPKGY